MATLVTRTTDQPDGTTAKGSELTHAEVDANFINLNSDKVEVSGAIVFVAKAGEALTKGDVVYVSGVSGNEPVVSKADADDASKMPAFGLAEADANLNAAVNVVTFGTLYDLDTSGFTVGDTVYVSTTAGGLTATKPAGEASLIQNIGKVIRSHAAAGSIKVGGAGRSNDTPNLNDGNVFIGNSSNQTETRALVEADISDLGTYLTAESDTLDSVTGRGATTTNAVTVGNLTSTGIDDNATSTAVTIDSSQNTTFAGAVTATSAVLEGTADSILTLRSTDDGPLYMEFERGTDRHAYMGFGGSNDTFKIWNEESGGLIQLGTNNTEAVRIDSSQNVILSGSYLELSNGGKLQVSTGSSENADLTGGSTNGTDSDGLFAFYGGLAYNTGAGIVLNGADHASLPNVTRFVNGAFVERMRISSTGTVGIGTSSPAQTLDVVGNIQSTGSDSKIIAGTAGQGQVALTLNDGGGNANLTFNHAGNAPDISGNNAARIAVNTDSTTAGSMLFQVGTAVTGAMATNFAMYATGDFHADGNVIAYSTSVSDERLKDDIQPITGALDAVDALRGVTFTWNDGSRQGKRDYGLIAQEVEKVIPEVVHETGLPLMKGEDDKTLYKTIDYDKLVSVLVEAISELRAEVEALKNGTSI